MDRPSVTVVVGAALGGDHLITRKEEAPNQQRNLTVVKSIIKIQYVAAVVMYA